MAAFDPIFGMGKNAGKDKKTSLLKKYLEIRRQSI